MTYAQGEVFHRTQCTRYNPSAFNVAIEHTETGLTGRRRDAVDLTLDRRFFGAVTERLGLSASVVDTEADELRSHLRFRLEGTFGTSPETFVHPTCLLHDRFVLGVSLRDLTHHLRVLPDVHVGFVTGVDLVDDGVHVTHVFAVQTLLEHLTHFCFVGDLVELFVQQLTTVVDQLLSTLCHSEHVDTTVCAVDRRDQLVVRIDVQLIHPVLLLVERLSALVDRSRDDTHVRGNAVHHRAYSAPVRQHRRLEVVVLGRRTTQEELDRLTGHDERQQTNGRHRAHCPTQRVEEPGGTTRTGHGGRRDRVVVGIERRQAVELRVAAPEVHHLHVVIELLAVHPTHAVGRVSTGPVSPTDLGEQCVLTSARRLGEDVVLQVTVTRELRQWVNDEVAAQSCVCSLLHRRGVDAVDGCLVATHDLIGGQQER
ncbi:hypothetical protein D3C81_689550 [compost metagenome]